MIQFECREEIFWKLKIFECNKGHAHTLATITHINRTQCKHQTLWRLSSKAMFTHVFRYPYIPQQIRSDPLQGPARLRWVFKCTHTHTHTNTPSRACHLKEQEYCAFLKAHTHLHTLSQTHLTRGEERKMRYGCVITLTTFWT